MGDSIIVSTPDICFGQPRIDGTRITVATVHGYAKCGMTPEQIRELEFPYVSLEAIQAAIDYPLPSGGENDCLADESEDDLRQMVATLTREREEAIAKLTSIKPEWEKFVEITEILDIGNTDRGPVTEVRNLIDRADRAEAQLAEAQRALEIDRHALSAMQRDLDQSRQEAERLRAMLRSLQWSITRQEGNTYWAHCPRCLKRMDHGHADDCPLAAALNAPTEGQKEGE